MKRRLFFLSVISVALVAGAGWYIYRTLGPGASAPVAAAPTAQPTVQTVNGETVVVVPPDEQRASRIEVTPLAAAVVRSGRTAYATVVDLQPLFDLRNRLATAIADRDTARELAATSQAQYERSRTLFADDRNVSQKALQDAQAAAQTARAKLQSADAAQGSLAATMRQQFGDVLTNAAMAPQSVLFQRLLAGQAVVVRVTLPPDDADTAPERIAIDGPDGQPVTAQKLSASPQGDPAVQGNPWLYAAARALPVGTRTSAHVPGANPAASALAIPDRAVVWYGGQPWVYVRTALDRFTRRAVPADSAGDQGFDVTTGFHAGDAVVTQGAQLLLSEEQKPQGIATVCKDPPECDD
ncbi:TPA: metal transporter [Burkholderia aenigmatica]|uniref:metal transporter n=1 Tax=Burkholderia sp. AU45251 TaxID=3059204 RepID=UPI00264C7C07|nr:metal transporter [Burkholderia sp. AU45251]HDR9482336.1 metal transporter [Burkholderia aenigmatica]MDN7515024.1 metal transporter [Burkholderia sp. AU45251]HDR9514642.1 metal transporter [Burkholderia aenigmatica]HDR9590707.1 metal transporter [Burkholderia aenigmatica]HDR9599863.1 metal transporter [Burkholderia aenigmatica]